MKACFVCFSLVLSMVCIYVAARVEPGGCMYARVVLTKAVAGAAEDVELYFPVGTKTDFSALQVCILSS